MLFQIGGELVALLEILVAVGDVDGQADDMLGPRAILGDDRDDVAQRLAELLVEAVRDDHLALVPADHPGGVDGAAAGDADAVGIALGPRPAGGLEDVHVPCSLSRSRAMITRWTSDAPS